MWYVLIAVLTIFFVKTAIDDVRTPPKYVSENYIGIFPPTKPNKIPHQLNPAAFPDEHKYFQYVPVLILPKNDRVKAPASKAIMLSDKKSDFDRPLTKGLAVEYSADESQINDFEKHNAKENLQNQIPAIKHMSGATVRQSAIEMLIRPLKIVAFCESGLRHYDEFDHLVRGAQTPNDIGVMQIKTTVHGLNAKRLGFDLKTPEGNVGYANWLYRKEGLRPWNASRSCWEPILQKLGYRNLS